jgi:hypothetical protein
MILILTIVPRELCIPLPNPAVNEECDLAKCGNPELMGDKQAQPLASCSDLGEIYSVESVQ